MRKFLLIIATCLFCVSCGVKNNPEYKSQNRYIKYIYLV